MFEKNPNLQNLLPQLDLEGTHPLRFSPVSVEVAQDSPFEDDDNWTLSENPDGENLIEFWNNVETDLSQNKIDFEN